MRQISMPAVATLLMFLSIGTGESPAAYAVSVNTTVENAPFAPPPPAAGDTRYRITVTGTLQRTATYEYRTAKGTEDAAGNVTLLAAPAITNYAPLTYVPPPGTVSMPESSQATIDRLATPVPAPTWKRYVQVYRVDTIATSGGVMTVRTAITGWVAPFACGN